MDEKTQTQIESHTEAVLPEVVSPPISTVSKSAELARKSAEYLDVVSAGKKLDPDDKNHIIKHTLENFDDYFNRGFLHYRKSVAEAEDFAAIEWTGQGSIIEDIMGRKFIDCLGGFGVYNMGIRHPKIIQAVKAQLDRMPLSSQELLDPLRGFLAELLGELAPGDLQECFFISNGTDAVEGALKLARLYTKKTGFISTTGAFHGKSMGSLSVMGRAVYRKPFQPLLSNIHFVDYGDIRDLERELKKLVDLGEDIAAIILEPVQGEAGAVVPPDDYLPRVRQLCNDFNVLLILDEVQTGMGRTGRNFACEHWNVVPDILCLGKALGGGVMPLSAFMSTPKIWKVLEDNPFLHSSTFGGNPLACAAGIAAINVLLEENLAQQAAEKGNYLMKRLRSLHALYPEMLKVVRGKGLLIGLEFTDRFIGYRVAAGLFKRGVLVAGTLLSARTIRIEPALNISYELLDDMLEKLADTLKQIDKQLDKETKEKAAKRTEVWRIIAMQYQWIAGKWHKPARGKIAVVNPATEEILDHVPRGTAADADLAVRAARQAFQEWRWIPALEKAQMLHRIAGDLRARQKKLATLMTQEGGKPWCENRDEVEWVAACFQYYAEVGRNSRGSSLPPTFHHQVNFTIKEPYGVVVGIIPWNYPLLLMVWKVAPALMAGNTVILKPSEETPLSLLNIADVFGKHLPAGVLNIVTGYGEEIGEALVKHPGTDLIAITGSVETGKRVGQLCAAEVKKFHGELGGNDPFIVCNDADLDIASKACAWAAFLNTGQVCTSAKRVYVFDDIADEFTKRVVKFTKSLKLGNGLKPDTDLGPLINLKQLEDVHARVTEAIRDGAKVLCGGKRVGKQGFFYQPTVIVNVKQKMRIVATETFGPILPILRVKDIDHAIELANDSRYGLGANIYTNNMEWAMKAMERITAGTFWINDPLSDNDAGPFGGMRQTGHSRELGEEGLDEFRETKHVHLDYKAEIKPYWYPYSKYNKL